MLTDALAFVETGGGYEGIMLFGGETDFGGECPPPVVTAVDGVVFELIVVEVVNGFDGVKFCGRWWLNGGAKPLWNSEYLIQKGEERVAVQKKEILPLKERSPWQLKIKHWPLKMDRCYVFSESSKLIALLEENPSKNAFCVSTNNWSNCFLFSKEKMTLISQILITHYWNLNKKTLIPILRFTFFLQKWPKRNN